MKLPGGKKLCVIHFKQLLLSPSPTHRSGTCVTLSVTVRAFAGSGDALGVDTWLDTLDLTDASGVVTCSNMSDSRMSPRSDAALVSKRRLRLPAGVLGKGPRKADASVLGGFSLSGFSVL